MPYLLNRHRLLPLLLTLLLVCVSMAAAVVQPAQASPTGDDPVPALNQHAHTLQSTEPDGDLSDLAPLGQMVGDAPVLGLGEGTHGSREFFTMKHRVFRYLVKEKGFTTFSLETGWSAGLQLNGYVLHGKGDPREIMREEFPKQTPWNTREYLDLIEWMRTHNAQNPNKVQFMGDDINYPTLGEELVDRVTEYIQRNAPTMLPKFNTMYRKFRSFSDMDAYLRLPLSQRRVIASQVRQALALLQRYPGSNPEEFDWTMQHARSLAQTATWLSYDLETKDGLVQALLYRDQAMADNTVWWHQQTGHKILLSAHNGHVAYQSDRPEWYPKTQGAFLRERLGTRYVSAGFTFNEGSFNAMEADRVWKPFTVGPAKAGNNEHTLHRVRPQDYFLDMRTAPAPARTWLDQARPTRSIGTDYPDPEHMVTLGQTYDVLIHLHRIKASDLLRDHL